MVMGAINLAGITPTETGYRIDPQFPFTDFSLRFPDVGLARQSGLIRGYVRPLRGGTLHMQVAIPSHARHPVAWLGGSQTRLTIAGGLASFNLPTRAGRVADWAISWQT